MISNLLLPLQIEMRLLGFGFLIILAFVKAKKYKPGTPGIRWTEYQAKVIAAKLHHLWDNRLDIAYVFDFNNTNSPSSNTDYLYDPDRRLSTVDCNWNEQICRTYWQNKKSGNRLDALAFGPSKAVR